MVNVFISYSRKNIDFVRKLFTSLEDSGRDAWVDWEGIPYSVDWWAEICRGIDRAEVFVFVISPDSLTSMVCHQELEYARENNKRIVPVIYQEVDEKFLGGEWFKKDWERSARENWEHLQKIQWLFFRPQDDFDTAFGSLIETVEEDPDHLRLHTRLLVRAKEWNTSHQHDSSLLLRGEELRQAENWMDFNSGKNPPLTSLHRKYIQASIEQRKRDEAQVRFRRRVLTGLTIVLAFALIGTMIATFFAFEQRDEAENQAEIAQTNEANAVIARQTSDANLETARREQEISRSLELAAVAEQFQQRGQLTRALYLAIEANNVETPPIRSQRIMASIAFDSPRIRLEGAEGISFSKGGNYLLLSDYSSDRLISFSTFEELRVFPHEYGYTESELSPDGQSIAFVSCNQVVDSGRDCMEGLVEIVDVQSGSTLLRFSDYISQVYEIEFSPDGNLLATTGCRQQSSQPNRACEVTVRRVADGEILHSFSSSEGQLGTFTFGIDSQSIFYGSMQSNSIGQWSLVNGEIVKSLTEPNLTSITDIEISSDGMYLFAGSVDGGIARWELETDIRSYFNAFVEDARTLALSPDGEILVVGDTDGVLTYFLAKTDPLTKLREYAGHTGRIYDIEFSADGSHLVTSNYQDTFIWDIMPADQHYVWKKESKISSIDISPDEDFIAFSYGTYDKAYVSIQNLQTGKEIKQIEVLGGVQILSYLAVSSQIVYVTWDGRIELFDWKQNKVLKTYQLRNDGEIAFSESAAVSVDGKYVVVNDWNIGYVFDVESWELVTELKGHQDGIISIAIAPDNRTLITASYDSNMRQWDLLSGQQINAINGSISDPYFTSNEISFTPDGQLILTVSDPVPIIWRSEDLAQIAALVSSNLNPVSLSVSPDGQFVVTGDESGSVFVWDVETRQILYELTGSNSVVTAIAWSDDTKYIVTGDRSGLVVVHYNYSADELLNWIDTNRVVGSFTCDEQAELRVGPRCTFESYYEQGLTAIQDENYVDAAFYFSRSIALDPDVADAYLGRGIARCYLGHSYEDVEDDFTRALELDSDVGGTNLWKAHYCMGELYMAQSNYEDAIDSFSHAIDLSSNEPILLEMRGSAYFAIQQFELALADYQQLVALDADNAYYWNFLGWIKYRAYGFQEAIADFSRAIELSPTTSLFYENRGRIYLNEGQFELAIEDFDAALEYDSTFYNALWGRGQAYFSLEDYDRALEDFQRSVDLIPEYPSSYYATVYRNLGDTLYILGQTDESLEAYHNYLDLLDGTPNQQVLERVMELEGDDN